MISEWFLGLFAGIGDWFLDLFGTSGPPDWIVQASNFIGELFTAISGLGGWVPFVLIGVVGGSLFTIWAVLWSVKGLRWFYGLFPIAGGT